MLCKSELKGFQTPGVNIQVVVTLFANDTIVYLSKNDDFKLLQFIFQKWCAASGARFNITKTEIIPVGSKLYRQELIQTRKLNPIQDPIFNNMKIATEGSATRILVHGLEMEQTKRESGLPLLKKSIPILKDRRRQIQPQKVVK